MKRVAAVIGAPVAHSRSPAMHQAAFEATGLDAVFVALEVAPGKVDAAIAGMAALGFLGASVTVPHKEAALAACDRVTPLATRIGAVNCVAFEDGAAIGHNTDAGGFVDALREELAIDPTAARVVLLGAGGAARAVWAGLADAGAEVAVIARSPQRCAWIAARPWTTETLGEALEGCRLLVDCTSMGLDPAREQALPAPIPVDRLPADAAVATLVYHRETALLAAARARGLATMDGAGMLVHQGARAFRLWTGLAAPIERMRAALET